MIAVARRKKPLELDAEVLTLPEVAVYLRCSPSTIYRLLKTGELHGFKVGAWRFSRAVLDAWMRERVAVSRTAVYPPRRAKR
jgi:excisionase family DNA binding protein